MFQNYSILLEIILNEIIPVTKKALLKGNKIFGAAILRKSDLSTICIGTNNEVLNPLYHGEISTIHNFFKKKINENPKDCLFLTTHEPCSLCLSAITWSGFDNFYYFFPFKETKDKFNIPHDLSILKEIFNINGGNYNKINKYWTSFSILDEIKKLSKSDQILLDNQIQEIYRNYSNLSNQYQLVKENNNIPLN